MWSVEGQGHVNTQHSDLSRICLENLQTRLTETDDVLKRGRVRTELMATLGAPSPCSWFCSFVLYPGDT